MANLFGTMKAVKGPYALLAVAIFTLISTAAIMAAYSQLSQQHPSSRNRNVRRSVEAWRQPHWQAALPMGRPSRPQAATSMRYTPKKRTGSLCAPQSHFECTAVFDRRSQTRNLLLESAARDVGFSTACRRRNRCLPRRGHLETPYYGLRRAAVPQARHGRVTARVRKQRSGRRRVNDSTTGVIASCSVGRRGLRDCWAEPARCDKLL
jgi:hypothetical protein